METTPISTTVASRCTETVAVLRPDRRLEVTYGGRTDIPTAGPRWCKRVATRWRDLIGRVSFEEAIDPAIVAAVMNVESCGDPDAGSWAGAMGLMQLMPRTFNGLMGRKATDPVDRAEAMDPELNVRLGARLLRRLLVRYEGNLANAAAAYNSGGARCGVYCRSGDRCCDEDPIWGYKTDCGYVGKVIAAYNSSVEAGFAPGAWVAPEAATSERTFDWIMHGTGLILGALAGAVVSRYAS